jgi:hypothetical protein
MVNNACREPGEEAAGKSCLRVSAVMLCILRNLPIQEILEIPAGSPVPLTGVRIMRLQMRKIRLFLPFWGTPFINGVGEFEFLSSSYRISMTENVMLVKKIKIIFS